MYRREPITRTIRVSSAAALVGLVPHYIAFYALGTPLYTDRIAEWIMAPMPSRYAVAILDALGEWAKPWACTGGLAALGFILFVARLAGVWSPRKWRSVPIILLGVAMAAGVAWGCGYSSFLGSTTFWVPALAIAALWPVDVQVQKSLAPPSKDIPPSRRDALIAATQYGLPMVMSAGVVAV